MAFKKLNKQQSVPDSPEKLILELPRRKIQGALLHQGESMRAYAQDAIDKTDVAIQLPTGSGKTLVGLMIAEWRRRKFKERVLYLCPTKQLVNQVVEQAEEQYGLVVNGFTGKKRDYDPVKKSEYQGADRVAITTYSSLFNISPFFIDPQTIIIDDAHSAENYIAAMWSLQIEKYKNQHSALHTAICNMLKSHMTIQDYQRLSGESQSLFDATWVDKLPTPVFLKVHDEFRNIVDSHVDDLNIRHQWSALRDNLHGCNLYMSSKDFFLRPLIPPTWTHEPFDNAEQRIFMSATLGAGGDLERLTGRKSIHRLPVPDGWDKQGIGRRFFIFPSLSLKDTDIPSLRHEMMEKAGRSVMLVPSDKKKDEVVKTINEDEFEIFDAEQIENSKKPFLEADNAIAVIANRYDGIDFPNDDCRVLFIDGQPKATNSQESFLMTKMGANVLFNERLQTRVLQAIGRCTRSLQDYSAVIVSGEHLPNYLIDHKKRSYFHPELQAELEFGIEQSKERTQMEMIENLEIFLDNGEDWEEANSEIIQLREKACQAVLPAIHELESVANKEIDYQKAIFSNDYLEALSAAESVLGKLLDPELKGYRALWYYLAGAASWLLFKDGSKAYEAKACEYFKKAKNATSGISWLSKLSMFTNESSNEQVKDALLDKQIENLECLLSDLGTLHMKKFDEREKEIIEGLQDEKRFENAHKLLGEMLGFEAGKVESDGSPDPWWLIENICLVFEDHAGSQGKNPLGAEKARQTALHPNWIRKNLPVNADTEILPVLISPVSKVSSGAEPHLKDFYFWELKGFIEWANNALAVVRELRKTFKESGDLVWRAEAKSALTGVSADVHSIRSFILENKAHEKMSA